MQRRERWIPKAVEGRDRPVRLLTAQWRKPRHSAILDRNMQRKILVILSNRWLRTQEPRLLELDCDAEGNILKQRRLPRLPARPRFDEVWENDEGRTDFASCHSFRRKYTHKLLKPRTP